jgi:hypothetical protein
MFESRLARQLYIVIPQLQLTLSCQAHVTRSFSDGITSTGLIVSPLATIIISVG